MALLNKSIVSPILVGRTEEVARLESAVATVSQGRGQVMLVTGEAGVGKSRLVGELHQYALFSGFTVLSGYCFEDDLLFPYAPLVDALRAFLAPQPASAVAARLGVLAVELVKLLPELTLTLPTLQPTPALDPESEKRRLFEALLQFLTQLTQGQPPAPLLLILEDLHWCDETSLDFLRLLARRITAWPILVLASYRRDESTPALKQMLMQLERGRLAQEVHLHPLPEPEVQTLLQAIFELNRPVRADFLTVLYRLTEGNPFFIEEVLKGLIARGDIFYADGQWDRKPIEELHIPATVQAAVQRRTAQVSTAACQVLTVAAVIGQRFDYRLLQQVTGRTDQELVTLLKELVAAQLVVEASLDHFAFRHALTRQAVYVELLGHERQVLHRVIGATIEQLYATQLDSHVSDLAYHFTEAGEWNKVLVYAQRAGEQAQALSTPHAAIEQFSRALQAAQQLQQSESLPNLYRARGLAYDIVGDFAQARSDLEMVLKLAQATADRQMEWQVLVNLGQMWTAHDYRQTGICFQQALALARTLETPDILAHNLRLIGHWHTNMDELVKAITYHQEALTIFERLGDQDGLAQTIVLLGQAHLLSGDFVQGAAYFQQAIALGHRLDDRLGLAWCLTNLAVCSGVNSITNMGIPAAMSAAACIAGCEQALQVARKIGRRVIEAYVLVGFGMILSAQGQYGHGVAMIQAAIALTQEIGHKGALAFALHELGAIALDLLALPTARQHFAQAWALGNEMGNTAHRNHNSGYLILIDILQNEYSKAEQALRSQLPPDPAEQTVTAQLLWQARIELALVQDDAALALEIIDRFFIAAPANRPISAIPYLAYLRGRALTALQHWAEAEATFQTTLATTHVQETPRHLWRIQLALGHLYQAQGRTGEAAQAFAAARTVIDQIAATIPDTALRDNFVQQTQAMLPPPPVVTPRPTAKASDAGLTRREREVAALIAAGKSNRAIAAALVIGERTVEGHVGNLLGKLGFTARAQIAVWAVENGLTKQ